MRACLCLLLAGLGFSVARAALPTPANVNATTDRTPASSDSAGAWGPSDIEFVHIVSSNHFDAGYTNFIVDVVNKYFESYIPKIQSLGAQLASNYNITFKYMLHAWVVSLYMDCLPMPNYVHCPSNKSLAAFIESVNSQQTFWYSFPFNSQLELHDPSMIDFGIQFGSTVVPSYFAASAHRPHVLSQRDVPGLSRSMIPLLVRNHVSAISVGANGRVAPLAVPNIFMWRDAQSAAQILGLYHGGGYGGTDLNSCVMVPNFTHTLATFWNGDNEGPPTLQSILSTVEALQKQFPNAVVQFSTFEAFVDPLLQRPDLIQALPVYEQEFGDTWVYGVQAAPRKLAQFRSAQRLRSACVATGDHSGCNLQSNAFVNFSRLLIKCGEHTFGGSAPHFIGSAAAGRFWSNPQLDYALTNEPFQSKFDTFRQTWLEQRQWSLDFSLQALQMSDNAIEQQLYQSIKDEWDFLKYPAMPVDNNNNIESNYNLIPKPQLMNTTFTVMMNKGQTAFNVRFDARTGSITMLLNTETNVNYVNLNKANASASASASAIQTGFGMFMYQTYNEANFSEFYLSQYSLVPEQGCNFEYCKNNLSNAANFTDTQYYLAANLSAFYQSKHDPNVFLSALSIDPFFYENFGAPRKAYVVYNFSAIFGSNADINENANSFGVQFFWVNKTYTRLPETLWMQFNPNIQFEKVLVNKIGEFVDIGDILMNGTFHLHAVSPNGCVRSLFANEKHSIDVYPMDSALAAFVPNGYQQFTQIVTPFVESDLSKGTSFSLFNNFWGTDYPEWYPFDPADNNATYRFNVVLN